MMDIPTLHAPSGYEVDLSLLVSFESGLDPHYPERSQIPARVLGYGEISTVFAIEGLPDLAFKRLPIFNARLELAAYTAAFEQYNTLLSGEVGLSLCPYGYAIVEDANRRPIFYIIQRREPAAAVAHNTLHLIDPAAAPRLFDTLLSILHRVWAYNDSQEEVQIGIDGQVSNWIVADFDPDGDALPDSPQLLYIDTSTPLFRLDGVEQLDPELFLRSAPSFLRWILRLFFLDDVVDRYYDFRLVVLDAIANLHKEQRAELIPAFLDSANRYFAAHTDLPPLTVDEVTAYYREDRLIWTLYLAFRRIDRTLHRLFRQPYPYILPGPIKR